MIAARSFYDNDIAGARTTPILYDNLIENCREACTTTTVWNDDVYRQTLKGIAKTIILKTLIAKSHHHHRINDIMMIHLAHVQIYKTCRQPITPVIAIIFCDDSFIAIHVIARESLPSSYTEGQNDQNRKGLETVAGHTRRFTILFSLFPITHSIGVFKSSSLQQSQYQQCPYMDTGLTIGDIRTNDRLPLHGLLLTAPCH